MRDVHRPNDQNVSTVKIGSTRQRRPSSAFYRRDTSEERVSGPTHTNEQSLQATRTATSSELSKAGTDSQRPLTTRENDGQSAATFSSKTPSTITNSSDASQVVPPDLQINCSKSRDPRRRPRDINRAVPGTHHDGSLSSRQPTAASPSASLGSTSTHDHPTASPTGVTLPNVKQCSATPVTDTSVGAEDTSVIELLMRYVEDTIKIVLHQHGVHQPETKDITTSHEKMNDQPSILRKSEVPSHHTTYDGISAQEELSLLQKRKVKLEFMIRERDNSQRRQLLQLTQERDGLQQQVSNLELLQNTISALSAEMRQFKETSRMSIDSRKLGETISSLMHRQNNVEITLGLHQTEHGGLHKKLGEIERKWYDLFNNMAASVDRSATAQQEALTATKTELRTELEQTNASAMEAVKKNIQCKATDLQKALQKAADNEGSVKLETLEVDLERLRASILRQEGNLQRLSETMTENFDLTRSSLSDLVTLSEYQAKVKEIELLHSDSLASMNLSLGNLGENLSASGKVMYQIQDRLESVVEAQENGLDERDDIIAQEIEKLQKEVRGANARKSDQEKTSSSLLSDQLQHQAARDASSTLLPDSIQKLITDVTDRETLWVSKSLDEICKNQKQLHKAVSQAVQAGELQSMKQELTTSIENKVSEHTKRCVEEWQQRHQTPDGPEPSSHMPGAVARTHLLGPPKLGDHGEIRQNLTRLEASLQGLAQKFMDSERDIRVISHGWKSLVHRYDMLTTEPVVKAMVLKMHDLYPALSSSSDWASLKEAYDSRILALELAQEHSKRTLATVNSAQLAMLTSLRQIQTSDGSSRAEDHERARERLLQKFVTPLPAPWRSPASQSNGEDTDDSVALLQRPARAESNARTTAKRRKINGEEHDQVLLKS